MSTLLVSSPAEGMLEPAVSDGEIALFAPQGFISLLSDGSPQDIIQIAREYGFEIDENRVELIRSGLKRLRSVVTDYAIPESQWRRYSTRADIAEIARAVRGAFGQIGDWARNNLVTGVMQFVHGLEEGFRGASGGRLVGLLAGKDPLSLRTGRFLGQGARVVVDAVASVGEALWQPLQRYGRRKSKFWAGMSDAAKAELVVAGVSLFLAVAFIGPWTPAEIARQLATEGEHAASVVYFLIDKHTPVSLSDLSTVV